MAEALERAGLFDRANPTPLDHQDCLVPLDLSESPRRRASETGWSGNSCASLLNGQRILNSDSMFHAHEVPVTLTGHDQLAIRFRALRPHLSRKLKRARGARG